MGARRLRDWLAQRLASVPAIKRRQDVVETFVHHLTKLEGFRAALGQVRDLERTIGRLSAAAGNARDLIALRLALEQVPGLKKILADVVDLPPGSELKENYQRFFPNGLSMNDGHAPSDGLLKELQNDILELPELVELISRAIVDEPPLALKEGGMIRDGFDGALDELHTAMRGGKDWIAKLQQDEIVRTGIQSLKVRFNSVFGYYIEITKANLDKVPETYTRKQTIANGERFFT